MQWFSWLMESDPLWDEKKESFPSTQTSFSIPNQRPNSFTFLFAFWLWGKEKGEKKVLSQGSANEGSQGCPQVICCPWVHSHRTQRIHSYSSFPRRAMLPSQWLLTSTAVLAMQSINLILFIIFFNNYKNNVFQIKKRHCLLWLFSWWFVIFSQGT